jgi:phage shock protein A
MQSSEDSARQASETKKQQLAELTRKIDEGERTATTLVARKNAATAQRKVSEALAGVSNADNAFAALGTFEEKVADEEAAAQAFNSLAAAGKDDELEKEFARLGAQSVDSELDALKRERQLQPPSLKELPAARL